MVDIAQVYDTVAPFYADYALTRKAYIESIDALVLRDLKPNMRLLDVGAGDGIRLNKLLCSSGITDAVAIELSAEMAKLCSKNAKAVVHQFDIGKHAVTLGQFNVITALWNVLGHIEISKRIKSLKTMSHYLDPEGFILLDVNNRHNAAAYGKGRVFLRRMLDAVFFKSSRGDSFYQWHIDGISIQSYGHLFTPAEMRSLFKAADLVVIDCLAVNYMNGKISNDLTSGQLFYKLKKS